VNTEAVDTESSGSEQAAASTRQWLVTCARRVVRAGAEAGYDAIVWVSALFYAAWITRDIPRNEVRALPLAGSVLVVCLLRT
jgi:hypothetical protein